MVLIVHAGAPAVYGVGAHRVRIGSNLRAFAVRVKIGRKLRDAGTQQLFDFFRIGSVGRTKRGCILTAVVVNS